MIDNYRPLVIPQRLWSRSEILDPADPVPRSPGVYAWYFRIVPPLVPAEGCITCGDLTLLCVGIAPKRPPRNGQPPSKNTLHDRLRMHLKRNARGSTLRLSLGCLLADQLGLVPRCANNRPGKIHFGPDGEEKLSNWLAENAFVTWMVHLEPWLLEEELIATLSLPLNLDQNGRHPFRTVLSTLRWEMKQRARTASELLAKEENDT